MRRVLVLGSTGSVGCNALDVMRGLPDRFQVVGLAARSSADHLLLQAAEFGVQHVALTDPVAAEKARATSQASAGGPAPVYEGEDAVLELMAQVDCDVVLQATVGAAALRPTLAALELGRLVALANKESLVLAGPLLRETARRHGATLVPVDSEHSAIYQCLRAGKHEEVERILLTTSGGAFRDRPLDTLATARPEEALAHPTWKMGPRITVDSATMMNKALEVCEAVALFQVPPDRIRVVLHPQSVVHSMVEFRDGSVMAQMSRPDMRLPILFALAYPDRPPFPAVRFSLADFGTLTFRDPEPERYPALELGFRAARAGGTSGAALNGADEAAVAQFLAGDLPFGDISRRVASALDAEIMRMNSEPHTDAPLEVEQILAADRRAREGVLSCQD